MYRAQKLIAFMTVLLLVGLVTGCQRGSPQTTPPPSSDNDVGGDDFTVEDQELDDSLGDIENIENDLDVSDLDAIDQDLDF